MPGCCECGNETSGSIKGGELLDQLTTFYFINKDSVPCNNIVICVHTMHEVAQYHYTDRPVAWPYIFESTQHVRQRM